MLELLRDTRVDLAHSGARFGEGCFETVRMQRGRPWRLDLHLERLARGCAFFGLDEPPPVPQLEAYLNREGIGQNLERAVLRLVAVDGTLRVWAEAAPAPPEGPVALGVSQWVTRHSRNALNPFKSLSYGENRRLHREAEARGLYEVIAANERGELTDGGRFTLLLRLGGAWVTPPVSSGALPGVARARLLEQGLVYEHSVFLSDLDALPELLLVNALRGGIPVGHFESHVWPIAPAADLEHLARALDWN